jgi:AcrR family transcriptional regulator
MDALSIRALTAELGVGRMSLYRHVENKDALLALVVNTVAERELLFNPADDVSWQDELRINARQIRKQLTRYPGLGQLLLTGGALGPASRRFAEQLLRVFDRAGFRDDDLAICYLIFIDTVLGRIYRETSGDFASNQRMRSFTGEADPEHPTPILTTVAAHLASTDTVTLFETMLDVMIQGFTTRLAKA